MPEKSYGGGSGTSRVYAIEVRTSYPQPEILSKDFAITGEWQLLPLCQTLNPLGIPSHPWCFVAAHLNLLTYEAAYALAAGFVTRCEFGGGCIEFRIVEIELKYSYETKELGIGDMVKLSSLSREAKFMPRDKPAPAEQPKEKVVAG